MALTGTGANQVWVALRKPRKADETKRKVRKREERALTFIQHLLCQARFHEHLGGMHLRPHLGALKHRQTQFPHLCRMSLSSKFPR